MLNLHGITSCDSVTSVTTASCREVGSSLTGSLSSITLLHFIRYKLA